MKKTIKTVLDWLIAVVVLVIAYCIGYENLSTFDPSDDEKARYFMAVNALSIKSMYAVVIVLCIRLLTMIKE